MIKYCSIGDTTKTTTIAWTLSQASRNQVEIGSGYFYNKQFADFILDGQILPDQEFTKFINACILYCFNFYIFFLTRNIKKPEYTSDNEPQSFSRNEICIFV